MIILLLAFVSCKRNKEYIYIEVVDYHQTAKTIEATNDSLAYRQALKIFFTSKYYSELYQDNEATPTKFYLYTKDQKDIANGNFLKDKQKLINEIRTNIKQIYTDAQNKQKAPE